MKNFVLVLALALAALLNGCGKTDPASGTFTNVYNNTLSKTCIECHKPTGAATTQDHVQLDFSTQALAYSTLTSGNVSSTATSGCSSVKIVSAGSVENSYLAGALFSDYNKNNFAGATGCQPTNIHIAAGYVSSDSEKTSILDWIRNGAQNN